MDSTAARPTRLQERQGRSGWLLIAADGRYLDADPVALDVYCVTLDVLRERRVGDFAPPEYRDRTRQLWDEWVASGIDHAESEWVVAGESGSVRLKGDLHRSAGGAVLVLLSGVEAAPQRPPAMRVQAVLGRWRELERTLERLPSDHPDRTRLEAGIAAAREDYRRRVAPAGEE